ncbi:MAG: hypothetical protein GXO91_06485 [FCB group bacterium]|nr:hypothetical protein [FCB group bacterium]
MKKDQLQMTARIMASMVGLVAITSLVLFLIQPNRHKHRIPLKLPSKIYEIAANFGCPCGGCVGESLAQCDCSTAKAIQLKIKSSLENGESEPAVLRMVEKQIIETHAQNRPPG